MLRPTEHSGAPTQDAEQPASPDGCNARRSPPDVAPLRKQGGLDDLRGHPGIGAGRAHLRGPVPLPRQAEVRNLQRLTAEVVVFYLLKQQNLKKKVKYIFINILSFSSLIFFASYFQHSPQSSGQNT